MPKNIVTPWSFRNGKNYIISFKLEDNPKSFSLSVADKVSMEEWKCDCDVKHVEDLTQRTGSFKPFDTFITMIQWALLKKTDAVSLELVTTKDLTALRKKEEKNRVVLTMTLSNGGLYSRQKSNNKPKPGEDSNDSTSSWDLSLMDNPQYKNFQNRNLFLVVAYVTEFDRINYPILLRYNGPPDPIEMQKCMRKLNTEIEHLKRSKSQLENQVNQLEMNKISNSGSYMRHNQHDDLLESGVFETETNRNGFTCRPIIDKKVMDDSRTCIRDQRDNVSLSSSSNEQSSMYMMMARLNNLEQRMASEQAELLQTNAKLRAENDCLRQKLRTQEEKSRNLQKKLFSLEHKLLTQGPHFQNGSKTSLKGTPNPSPTWSKRGDNALETEMRIQEIRSRCRGFPRPRSKSLHDVSKPRIRSRSPSPFRRFDPTAYIQSRALRQGVLQQLRDVRLQRAASKRDLITSEYDTRNLARSISRNHVIPNSSSTSDSSMATVRIQCSPNVAKGARARSSNPNHDENTMQVNINPKYQNVSIVPKSLHGKPPLPPVRRSNSKTSKRQLGQANYALPEDTCLQMERRILQIEDELNAYAEELKR